MPSTNQATPISHLILGGARSGKSHYAEELAKTTNKEIIYIATAKILDHEIEQRVAHHQKNRPDTWKTIEEPLHLADTLSKYSSPDNVLLVDCLTMWVTNLLSEGNEAYLQTEVEKLLNIVENVPGTIIFVSNEVGMGIIPMGELTRKYVDEAGRLHQKLAQSIDSVTLMVAGLPLSIKAPS